MCARRVACTYCPSEFFAYRVVAPTAEPSGYRAFLMTSFRQKACLSAIILASAFLTADSKRSELTLEMWLIVYSSELCRAFSWLPASQPSRRLLVLGSWWILRLSHAIHIFPANNQPTVAAAG